jgi:Na+/proline symporter/signal transduction histidine kinase/ActR/RegA family two-component response regulator
MIESWTLAVLALGYVGALFLLAWIGDRFLRSPAAGKGRPFLYALSIAVYCTSWTFYGSVGLSASTGYDFLPVYIGPILLFAVGWPLVVRIVRLAKSQNITSVSDFLAARYGKSPAVAALATVIAVVGVLPYMALQLKAVVVSIETLLGEDPTSGLAILGSFSIDMALVIAVLLAAFAILFGTRHIDATEHQDGLMLAIAAESLVKLAAFLAIGAFIFFGMLGGPGAFIDKISSSAKLQSLFGSGLNGGWWLTVTLLSLVCIVLLPRQFHVTVVENHSESEIRRAAWLFPLYLILINLFVVPIAVAGLLLLKPGTVAADMYVLALPLAAGAEWLAVIAFLGGVSAATAMVIVDGVALAIMVCNGLAVPWLLRREPESPVLVADMAGYLLRIRRIAIFVVVLLAYVVYRALAQVHGLAQIGLVSFSAIAQLAPAFFGGLLWRRATARGAIAGMSAGTAVWAYTLVLPWAAKAGWLPIHLTEEGPLGLGFLKPEALLYLNFDPLSHGVFWSLIANIFAYVFVSLLRPPVPIERLQAHAFVLDEIPRPASAASFRLWRTSLSVGDLQQTAGRYLGVERAQRSFEEHAQSRGIALKPQAEADVGTIRFTEHLLASAIGAASARLVLSLLLRRGNVANASALRLLDDASEALQYNRDLLQSAIDQVRHGLSVLDKDMRLICWNRQFRELLSLPPDLGRVGVPLEQILRAVADRGDLGPAPADHAVADIYVKLAETRETFQLRLVSTGRILEIRTAPMPQGGIVTTYADITERFQASEALARANETLERRVRERTAELTRVNNALAIAKAKADEANLDKTRFLAAASHDILQPLNAARLYASTLAERKLDAEDGRIARNIDRSLEAVEEILGTLLDISRLDAGHLVAEMQSIKIATLFDQLRVEFEPLAARNGLELRFVATEAWVRSDRRLLRRVLQNLLGNALKYTRHGGVLVGCRRRGDSFEIQVVDTGPGIPLAKQALIFKEFQRLEQTAATVRGLGLGLSIVERICRVLETNVRVVSTPGRGSTFSILLPRSKPDALAAASVQPIGIGGQTAGCLVLCIDNERQVLDGMHALLSGWGCETILAESKREALAAVEAGRRPDIVFADYHLDEESGLEAIAGLRQVLGPDLPAVVITADHSAGVQRLVRLADCHLLRKPVKAGALRALVGTCMTRRATAAE